MSEQQPYQITSPWQQSIEEEKRFRRIVAGTLTIFTIIAIIVPFIVLPKIEREQVEKIPPRLAKLLIEKKKAPAPPPKPKAKAKKKTEKKKEKKPEKKVEKKKAVKKPAKKIDKPKKNVEKARKKAMQSGLLALQDELSGLLDDPTFDDLKSSAPLSKSGTQKSRKPSAITASVGRGSSGISTDGFNQEVDQVVLASRTTERVTSETLDTEGIVDEERKTRARERSLGEIIRVFERYKSAIYAIYNRSRRKDPTISGKVLFEFTIAPSGKITKINIVSTEIDNPNFLRKLKARVKSFNFGAKDVKEQTFTFPYDFVPV